MSQFGTTGKNPPWARNTGAGIGAPTAQLLVQTTLGGSATQPVAPAGQQATAYNAGLATLRLAQVGLDQPCRENVFLVQNALQPGTVLSQPGVAIPTSLTATNPGIALPTTLSTGSVATVSYPTPRSMHPSQSQFQSQHQHQQQLQGGPQQQQQQQQQQVVAKQRVFTGTVSKLHDNFGFVDDDVFFQITCVKGAMPKVGDRVLVEASYSPNMPFKWNAARIQMLPSQVQTSSAQSQQALGLRPSVMPANSVASSMNTTGLSPQIAIAFAAAAAQPGNQMVPITIPALAQSTQAYNQVPPPQAVIHAISSGAANMNRLPSLMGTRRHSPPVMRREREREVRRDERRDRERHREREHERERVPVVRKRSRSPRPRSRTPPRRRARIAPRYTVQVPKLSLDLKEANVLELRKRYASMYVPSDFFFSSFVWMEAFPLYRPFVSERPCHFHIMNKEVDPIHENDAVLDPPDADHSFSAKVMLMSAPLPDELYQKCCGSVPADAGGSGESFVHPTRLVSFLVGLKSKNETMAIGGPWSPSLDGADPRSDPSVLIRTAVRTCKGLTGIDLGACTKWYRFAEIYYHRRGESSSSHKGRNVAISSSTVATTSSSSSSSSSSASAAVRVETVVIFLPDVWSCTPTLTEWDALTSSYRKQLVQKRQPAGATAAAAAAAVVAPTVTGEDNALAESKDNQCADDSPVKDSNKRDPTHHSELDPKTMKIAQLRQELESRNMNSKGLKSQLVARLSKVLKIEHEKEEGEAELMLIEEEPEPPPPATPCVKEEKIETDEKEEEKTKGEAEERQSQHRSSEEERERETREKRNYKLPESPSLIVHPSRTAKGGRFDCTVMSLSVLLDYRPEDNKEHSFEVSLFAELFNEMLVRDYAFRIYRAIVEAPERKDVGNNGGGADVALKDKKKEKKDDKKEGKEESTKKDDKKKKDDEDKDKDLDDEDEEDDDVDDEIEEDDEEESKEKKKDEEESKEKKKDEEESKEKKKDEEESKHKKKDDSSKKKDSKDRKSDAFKSSSRSIDPSLLLACVYFDQNHCGYIMDKDLEDVLNTLGLNLSRAQTRKLLQNVLTKDKLLYCKLSDGVKTKDLDQDMDTIVAATNCDENKEPPNTERPVSSVEDLAAGNKLLLPCLRGSYNANGGNSSASDPPTVSEAGLVVYNGALLDIAKLLQQLQRSESARTQVEISMKDTQQELSEVKELASNVEQTNQVVSSDLREVKQRLRNTEDELKVQQERSHKYMKLLRECHDIIQPAIVTAADVSGHGDHHRRADNESAPNSGRDDGIKLEADVICKKEILENGDT